METKEQKAKEYAKRVSHGGLFIQDFVECAFMVGWDAAMEYIQNLPEWKQIMNAVDETKKELGIFQNGNNQ